MADDAKQAKKVSFSQVSNHVLKDDALSLRAKGLYCLIKCYITIPGFILYKNTLKKSSREGETAFENAWKELKDKGYLLQWKVKAGDGRFHYGYKLPYENDHTHVSQGVEKPDVDNPGGGKKGCINKTDASNTELNKTDISKSQSPKKRDNVNDVREKQTGKPHADSVWNF